MNEDLEDAIAIQAYTELMISCQIPGCTEDFDECFRSPAKDPVERWANEMADMARREGWGVDDGRVVCSRHFQRKP